MKTIVKHKYKNVKQNLKRVQEIKQKEYYRNTFVDQQLLKVNGEAVYHFFS